MKKEDLYTPLNRKCPFCNHKVYLFKGIITDEPSVRCMNIKCNADIRFMGKTFEEVNEMWERKNND